MLRNPNTRALAVTTSADGGTLPKVHHHRRTNSSFASSLSPDASRNSSLQKVWAEDYLNEDGDANDKEFIIQESRNIHLTPPPATLSTPLTSQRKIHDDPAVARRSRQQQRSLTALLPFRIRSNSQSPQRSPKKEAVEEEFMPTLTGDKDGQLKVADKGKGLSSWFSGSSAPMAVGIPVGEQEASSNIMPPSPSKEDGPNKLRRGTTLPILEAQKSSAGASTSVFGFFGNAIKSPTPKKPETVQLPTSMVENDPLLTMDIHSSLFPSGAPSEKDPFSPAAFKNLLQNAEGLLAKLQSAYKLRTLSLHEMTAEKEAQKEELEEAETRATHLKLQLVDMAKRVTEHDKVVESLVGELAQERGTRRRENEARERSITLIKSRRLASQQRTSEDADIEEDLGISQARSHSPRIKKKTWRNSGGSTSATTAESDDEADALFSDERSRSPTLMSSSASVSTSDFDTASAATAHSSTPEISQAGFARIVNGVGVTSHPGQQQKFPLSLLRPKVVQRTSTFSKMLKGGSVSEERGKVDDNGDDGQERCKNCAGGEADVAWDTVGLLKVENKGLKGRVEGLEDAVERALGLIREWGI